MNRSWTLRVGPACVAVETAIDLREAAANVRSHGGNLLFQLAEEKTPNATPHRATVVHVGRGGGHPGARYDGERGRLEIRADAKDLGGVDLLFLSYLLLEAQLHRRGLVTLHAAAVEHEGRAALLVGHPGAGKTTTALSLCREYGCRLVGNDLVVVGGNGEPRAWCGTNHIRLRHSSIAREMPDLLHLFSADEPDPWRSKRDLSTGQLGVRVADRPATLVAVVFVHVDSDYPHAVVAEGDTLIHRLNLYENALRYIRATGTPWMVGVERRFGPFVPSFDDPYAHEARTATLNRLLNRSHYLAGPLAEVAVHVAHLLGIAEPARLGDKEGS